MRHLLSYRLVAKGPHQLLEVRQLQNLPDVQAKLQWGPDGWTNCGRNNILCRLLQWEKEWGLATYRIPFYPPCVPFRRRQ